MNNSTVQENTPPRSAELNNLIASIRKKGDEIQFNSLLSKINYLEEKDDLRKVKNRVIEILTDLKNKEADLLKMLTIINNKINK